MKWRKSSRSAGNGACVEMAFVRSTRCDTSACVEVAYDCAEVLVRDSKDPDGPVLSLSPTSWRAFLADIVSGEYDL